MLCEKILGTLGDAQFQNLNVDYVDIEWHEAFKKLHKKKSQQGRDIGISLGNEILTIGLNQDDVLGIEGDTVIAVNIPPCEALVMTVEHNDVKMVAKLCYEIGNKHATLFRGDDDYQFITPLDLPIKALMEKLGVKVERKTVKFDFKKKISSSINAHTH